MPILNPLTASDATVIMSLTVEGRRWKTLMAFCGMSSDDFALKIGENPQHFTRWFVARTCRPRLETATKVARALGISLDQFVEYLVGKGQNEEDGSGGSIGIPA